ncbi:hypothetical protein FRB97_002752 [Tulasnella sp. 331]|nr:hypothetical protein FRB97_002752 [Tulasnella sp. 331]KAG8883700.1 hypothetical protein FRB98_002858 [Tulasnella sp. 332]
MPPSFDGTVPLENITFGGKDTEDVTLFLQNVKRVAFAQGRQRDCDWLADYVETCLTGRALLWHDTLDEKTSSDYKLLRTAMLQYFVAQIPTANIPSAPPAAPSKPFSASGPIEQ